MSRTCSANPSWFVCALLCLWLTSTALAAEDQTTVFEKDIQPLLKKFCVDCHGPFAEEGGVRLDRLGPISETPEFANVWVEVRDRVVKQEMPPEEADQPSEQQRAKLIDWISGELKRAREAASTTGGKVVLRRLNRSEYRETLRELFSLHPALDTAANLPDDDTFHGFDNIGSALNISPVQMRVYLDNAMKVLEHAFPAGKPPKREFTRIVAMDAVEYYQANDAVKAWKQRTNGKVIPKQEFERQKREVMSQVPDVDRMRTIRFSSTTRGEYKPDGVIFNNMGQVVWGNRPAGLYRFRFTIKGIPNKRGDMPMLSVALTARPPEVDQQVGVTDTTTDFVTYELEAFAQPHYSSLRFEVAAMGNRYFYKRGVEVPRLMIQSLEIEGPIIEQWPSPAWHEYFGDAEDNEASARAIISKFAERAFRRPPKPERIDQFVDFYKARRAAGDDFQTAVKLVMRALLASPEFLFMLEPKASEKRERLDNFELATRLSYFLWSGPPDTELYARAKAGKLTDAHVLVEQARRMLRHPRAQRFAENFTGQWLKLRTLGQMAPDPRKYTEWEETLQESMRKETELYFLHLLQNDLPVSALLDSDFSMLNGRLAYFYGIPDVNGYEFRRVSLEGTNQRGGLLGQASLLTLTSDGLRTSPVKRGAFILENLLGDPPPPPPNDVPPVEESTGATLRERLASHRSIKACANCHAKIDPLGFALENFNAIGKWRVKEEDSKQPIDSSGVMPDGSRFVGFDDFKQVLATRSDEVAHCLCEKLLMYALGRPLDFTDEPVIKKIVAQTQADGNKLSAMVLGIIQSEPFLTK